MTTRKDFYFGRWGDSPARVIVESDLSAVRPSVSRSLFLL